MTQSGPGSAGDRPLRDRPVQTRRFLPWVSPLSVAAAIADRPGALCLLSDPTIPGSRSFIAADPDHVGVLESAPWGELFRPLNAPGWRGGGVVGLASYDAGAREATGSREPVWPDLIMARYPAVAVFDHDTESLTLVGWGRNGREAGQACDEAQIWFDLAWAPDRPAPPATVFSPDAPPRTYRDAVAEVVARIAAGELFQANIARGWSGALNEAADPFDVFLRLTLGDGKGRIAPYGAFWRVGDRALVSNSPELFLALDAATGRIETRPIKGTRPRHPDPAVDALNAAELRASAKDRAENLMIVDLMRNDLARVCRPGSVVVEKLFEIESHPTVHHLVSTVSGTLAPGLGPARVLEATFPPGSITGAPKHQAMKVIASLEPPRGAWCGSLFVIDENDDLTASVLIRTATFEKVEGRWTFRTQAGAGIVADSDPEAELQETEAKISALRAALTGRSA
ncbi:anthranilate synthase component I family protein [Brevundimonas goettingensis]|uniref:Chorismate-binding protein n=1 Tax=Brevundimonas goettingensis TaxID=2774190 RepID=A0A975GY69_9CAUL|nr:chorismate-binding protein [Brevundimonas goettingensis]QTC91270.1 chorismate-binding protein [Brevundimonas goettingensis]